MLDLFIERSLSSVLLRAVSEFPAVVLSGPRQSGKTTLLQHLFGQHCKYVSLDSPDVRAVATQDPRGFLAMYASPVIFDEIQNAPELLPYIKERIDADRSKPGQYFLTGSQNLLLGEQVNESLAGRAAILRLLPLANRELAQEPLAPLPWEVGREQLARHTQEHAELWEGLLRGGYPELACQPNRDVSMWQSSYTQTYLERDVRSIRQVGDLIQYQNFLKIVAARSGQLLNLSDVARDLGVAVNTAKSWLSILEATYQVIVVRPYFANVGKRLVKTPKVYFSDTGTLCHLVGLKDPEHAAAGPMGGAILETAVLSEIVRTLTHRGEVPQVYFWRTTAGAEVDFVVVGAYGLIAIEVKQSATPRPAMAAGIKTFRKDMDMPRLQGYVIHTGDSLLPLGDGITALPYANL